MTRSRRAIFDEEEEEEAEETVKDGLLLCRVSISVHSQQQRQGSLFCSLFARPQPTHARGGEALSAAMFSAPELPRCRDPRGMRQAREDQEVRAPPQRHRSGTLFPSSLRLSLFATGDHGAYALADAIKANAGGLERVALSGNPLSRQGVDAIIDSIEHSGTVTECCLNTCSGSLPPALGSASGASGGVQTRRQKSEVVEERDVYAMGGVQIFESGQKRINDFTRDAREAKKPRRSSALDNVEGFGDRVVPMRGTARNHDLWANIDDVCRDKMDGHLAKCDACRARNNPPPPTPAGPSTRRMAVATPSSARVALAQRLPSNSRPQRGA